MAKVADVVQRVVDNVEKVIIGKRPEVEMAFLAFLGQGHLLIEDVPGTGKTTLAKSLARSTGCSFRRLQFTPDLLPSDITGTYIYNQKTADFEFRPGPIMAQIVLVDEINRATPKTQSALLECMEERQVTVEGVTYPMPRPFLVMATQNPIEYEGTFPLPEAQLDRFLMRINLGYPSASSEVSIIERQQYSHPVEELSKVIESQELLSLQEAVRAIYVDDLVKRYIVDLVAASRQHPSAYLGASPRGSLGLFRASQARALAQGRDFVLPDDIKVLAEPILAHRLVISTAARMQGVTGKSVVADLLERVPVVGALASQS